MTVKNYAQPMKQITLPFKDFSFLHEWYHHCKFIQTKHIETVRQ